MGSFASEDDGSSHYPEVGNASTAQWPGADYAGSLFSAARTSPTLSMWPLLAVAWCDPTPASLLASCVLCGSASRTLSSHFHRCWLTAPVLLAPVPLLLLL